MTNLPILDRILIGNNEALIFDEGIVMRQAYLPGEGV